MERFFVELSNGNCDDSCNCDCHGDGCYCITD